MAKVTVDILVRDLVRLLNDLIGLHGEMGEHMQSKLAAMRRADTDAIASITAQETTLANRVIEREGLARQMTRRIAAGMGLDGQLGDPVRLTVLAEHLAEPRRSQVLGAATGLIEKINEIEKIRVVTTLITEEMLKHLREVLVVMTSGDVNGEVYGRTGQRQRAAGAHVFEAVG